MSISRVPPATVQLYSDAVALVVMNLLPSLPAQASEAVRAYTTEQCIEIILRDARENGNVDSLDEADIEDLRSFIQMSATLCADEIATDRFPIYRATLKALLEDWLYNWNDVVASGAPAT